MTHDPYENLDRLISRFLDEECSDEERRQLNDELDRDPLARSRFDEYAALDREAGTALRWVMSSADPVAMTDSAAPQAGRLLSLQRYRPWLHWAAGAAAAVLGLLAWLQPPRPDGAGNGNGIQLGKAGMSSWFAPPPDNPESFLPVPAAYERPQYRIEQTQREWIMIPAETPGQFYLIQVDRRRTHGIALQSEF